MKFASKLFLLDLNIFSALSANEKLFLVATNFPLEKISPFSLVGKKTFSLRVEILNEKVSPHFPFTRCDNSLPYILDFSHDCFQNEQ